MLVKMGTKAMMKLRIQMPTINEITTFRLKIEHFSGNNTLRLFGKNLEARRSQVYNRVFLGEIEQKYLDIYI